MPLFPSKEAKDCPLPRRAAHEGQRAELEELAGERDIVFRRRLRLVHSLGWPSIWRELRNDLNALEATERALGVEHVRMVTR